MYSNNMHVILFFYALPIFWPEVSERFGSGMLHLGLAQKAPALTKMLIAPRD